MSVLAYPRTNEEEIFRHCTKDCGIVSATEDFQYFALRCASCSAKFQYFDAFIGHMQTMHLEDVSQQQHHDHDRGLRFNMGVEMDTDEAGDNDDTNFDEIEDLTDADTALLVPQMVIKQEISELDNSSDEAVVPDHDVDDDNDDEVILPETTIPPGSARLNVSAPPSQPSADRHFYPNDSLRGDGDSSVDGDGDQSYMDDNSGDYAEYNNYGTSNNSGTHNDYDEMVEESLLGRDRELTMHIKDRKMIQFLIQSYKRNPFLWDHSHAQFRDRVKRGRFLDWIVLEFTSRFNISLAKDAITRKWDNLRTVYKRECNRMALEKTNISTLWYFKELHFLNEVYSYNSKMSDAVVKETSYRRRFSAIWNDTSTAKLLSMVKRYQCFYNRFDPDYRSKERRGEGLQQMALELQQMIDVTTIQISKRISQLRFDYSKQKVERLNCERIGRKFIPNYIYYDQMHFMDDDIPPFKCQQCPEILQTLRELDLHVHQPSFGGGYYCNLCKIQFHTAGEFDNHKHMHGNSSSEIKFNCELCTASFREKSNYDEHVRRHNEELLLPSLAMSNSGETPNQVVGDDENPSALNEMYMSEPPKPFPCEVCHRSFASPGHLNAHMIVHQDDRERTYKCDYPQCNKSFMSRHNLFDHLKQHYNSEEFKCDICGKTFKSTKNLQNHKQIHDKIKRYICQICGSAFAQAAGLYLHKRRHNRSGGGPVGGGGRGSRNSL
ncbi:zinc finger protein 667 [Scaptodrosophila lebanonensis]|uniref:Zinc finger protein 667 n=1 Tax=Drosophila lebanonensis TaxID=7225 RepID=A0A6J2TRY1_DROLE|nr:zinc finger protein 667 [Scaptodrosophila lebanonensis]